MSSFISRTIILLFCLFALRVINFGQEQKSLPLFDSLHSFDSFEQKVNFHQDALLFKVMRFYAPYGGMYNETNLMKNGDAFNARFTPYAVQNSRKAKLNRMQLEQLKQKLTALIENLSPNTLLPVDKEIYTAFVVANGYSYSRYNFIGEMPAPLQDILDSLKTEFEKVQATEHENFLATEKLLKEKYGDWLNTPGIIRPAASGFQTLTDHRKILLYLKGHLQPVENEKPPEIPLYYILVSYPAGRTIGGASGGHGGDPLSVNGIIWSVAKNGATDRPENQRKLEIEYHAISGTIRIANKVYQLSAGNLFFIEMTEHWQARVERFNIHLRQPTENETFPDYFKRQLKDKTLELPKRQ